MASILLFWVTFATTRERVAPVQEATPAEDGTASAQAVVESFHEVLLDCMKQADELGFQGRYDRLAASLDETFDLPVAFPSEHLDRILGQVVADAGLRQLELDEALQDSIDGSRQIERLLGEFGKTANATELAGLRQSAREAWGRYRDATLDLWKTYNRYIGKLSKLEADTRSLAKEASVYRCRATSAAGGRMLAAKVYRPRMFRNLRNDKMYRQGKNRLFRPLAWFHLTPPTKVTLGDEDADHRPALGKQRERCTGVEDESEVQPSVDDDDRSVGQHLDRPGLGRLVDADNEGGNQNREKPEIQRCDAASTVIVAYGRASSLATGIGSPVISHIP